ncbi:FxSxx-COOH system tetratricopeptide repeat protein [Lentzea sp. BCCO 10_0798]|uniref:FxSxx-COOH system tetratricopeptide repeat protein n=1 Tax=Lentzea kristufekii TaxID=3095430 RepID=A0ABU4TK84_9PSEU|nr:FxSxx-COOH system tetratricopeptide repeat protein [Lentzea sp. BCCO 10_0798]MDX8048615.1 FxSxx-COOH system tetratricopeptide repeat protein [Lentzea sp. BCCO 10_0798]
MSAAERDLTARELADALWLASQMWNASREVAGPAAVPATPARQHVVLPMALPPPEDVPPALRSTTSPHVPTGATRSTKDDVPPRFAPGTRPQHEPGAARTVTENLPHTRAISRALRPLARLVPSDHEVEFDEETTAVRVAETGVWLPAFLPALTRPFEIALVVDTASLEIWQREIADFRAVLETEGAFRTVRLYFVDFDQESAGDLLVRVGAPDGPSRGPAELLDPSGGRLVLVVTDGVGRAWHTGAADRVIGYWGRSIHVSVMHLLPHELWSWTGLVTTRVQLRMPDAGAPNARIRYRLADPSDERPPDTAVPVPVLELRPDWLGHWTRLVTGDGPAVRLTTLFADPSAKESTFEVDPLPHLSPADRVSRFRTIASPPAFALAGLLAATPVPLKLPVMSAVRQTVLPGTKLSHLAEVLLGGLVERDESTSSPGTYEFREGLRQELLSTCSRADTARVLRTVADFLGPKAEAARGIKEALDDPDSAISEATPESLPHLRLQQVIFRAMSGPYVKRSNRIRAMITDLTADRVEPETESADSIARVSAPAEEESPSQISTINAADPGGTVTVRDEASSTILSQQGDAPRAWSVPPRNFNFTGRTAMLAALNTRLTSGDANPTAVLPEALYGLGGIGKSQVAVEYAYLHADDYDVVWWIPSEDPTHIRSVFVELAAQLGIPNTGAVNSVIAAVRESLRRGHPYRRWLLVFDNADKPEDVRPFFPTGGSGHILVTSRNTHWSSVAQTVEVDLFSRAESKQLLQRRNQGLTDSDAEQVADVLGDLPLAIEQAASWLRETGMNAGEYLSLFARKRAELLEAGLPVDYHVPVAAAWNVSFDRLSEENPAALQLLQVCAFFAPEPISRSLFIELQGIPVPDELGEALRDPLLLGKAMRQINKYSLAQIDQSKGTILLHRLVQGALFDRMTPQERAQMRHAAHVLLATDDPRGPATQNNWPKYIELLPHVRASKMQECDDPWVRRTALHSAVFLAAWGDDQSGLDYGRELLAYWSERFGEEKPDTLSTAKQVGVCLRALGRYTEALAVDERAYAVARENLGEESENTLVLANMVAQDVRALGEFTKAWQLSDGAYRTAKAVYGEEDGLSLAAADNLGIALRLVGRFAEARDIDQATWEHRARILGDEHRFTLSMLNNLCLDIRECGEYVQARDMLETAVAKHRRLFGDDHPDTLRAIKNLAVARRKAGDHAGALRLSEEAVLRYAKRYGDNYPGSLAASLNLAVDLRQAGALTESRALGEQVLAAYAETLGENHPYVLAAKTNLAVTLRLMGELERAAELNEDAFVTMQDALGYDHPFTLVCATNRASDHAASGDFERSYALNQRVLERSQRVLGEDHPSTLACLANIVLDLRGLGRTADAESLQIDVISRFRRALGKDHPATVAAASSTRADCDLEALPTG